MLLPALALIAGLVLLVYAADRFIAGAAISAHYLGVSSMVIGLVIIGFGTSAPEMVVSAVASLRGNSELALGNAVGSNITNTSLVLGIGILVSPLLVSSETVKRELPLLIAVTVLVFLLMLDGRQSRIDGFILLTAMVVVTLWLGWLGMRAGDSPDSLREHVRQELAVDMSKPVALGWLFFGVVMLPLASNLMVYGATEIAYYFGVSEVVVGLTIVALGTSLPELAAAVASAVKKEHDLLLGNIVGSNLFNLLGVLGISASIHPYRLPVRFLEYDYLFMALVTLGFTGLSWWYVREQKVLNRPIGTMLLLCYGAYMAWLASR